MLSPGKLYIAWKTEEVFMLVNNAHLKIYLLKYVHINDFCIEILPALACRSKLTARRGMPAEQTFRNKFRTAGDRLYKQSSVNLYMLPVRCSKYLDDSRYVIYVHVMYLKKDAFAPLLNY